MFLVGMLCLGLTSCSEFAKGLVNFALNSSEGLNHEYVDSEDLGKVVETPVACESFDRLDISGAVRLILTQSADSSVSVVAVGNEKSIEEYKIQVVDGVLIAKLHSPNSQIKRETPRVTLRVSVPELKDIDMSGLCLFEQEGTFVQQRDLSLSLSGAGNFTLQDLQASSVRMHLSGAADMKQGKLTCQGLCLIKVSGAADINANVNAPQVECEISGAGDMKMNVDCEDLTVGVSGAGDVTLSGECKKFALNSSKACKVDTKNLKGWE